MPAYSWYVLLHPCVRAGPCSRSGSSGIRNPDRDDSTQLVDSIKSEKSQTVISPKRGTHWRKVEVFNIDAKIQKYYKGYRSLRESVRPAQGFAS